MTVARPPVAGWEIRDAGSERAATATALEHPNLSPVPEGGVTLKMILDSSRMALPQAIVVGLGVLAGLRALQSKGRGHGALDTSSVNVARNGQARLTGCGHGSVDPSADVMAAGRVICAALGVDPRPPRNGPSPNGGDQAAWLATAARTIAGGGAGPSAAAALMIFGDAAGRMGPGLRIQRTPSAIERLAIPPPSAISAAVDRVLATAALPVLAAAVPRVPKSGPVPAPAPVAAPPPPAVAQPTPAPVSPAEPVGRERPAAPSISPARPARIAGPAIALATIVVALLGLLTLLLLNPVTHRATPRPANPAEIPSAAAQGAATPPAAVVIDFYQLVAARKFDEALALWDDDLRAALGPAQYPQQRFADTTQLTVNSTNLASHDSSSATVAVDLTEVTDGVRHHWVGSWRLVNTKGGWLLDKPDFQEA